MKEEIKKEEVDSRFWFHVSLDCGNFYFKMILGDSQSGLNLFWHLAFWYLAFRHLAFWQETFQHKYFVPFETLTHLEIMQPFILYPF